MKLPGKFLGRPVTVEMADGSIFEGTITDLGWNHYNFQPNAHEKGNSFDFTTQNIITIGLYKIVIDMVNQAPTADSWIHDGDSA